MQNRNPTNGNRKIRLNQAVGFGILAFPLGGLLLLKTYHGHFVAAKKRGGFVFMVMAVSILAREVRQLFLRTD